MFGYSFIIQPVLSDTSLHSILVYLINEAATSTQKWEAFCHLAKTAAREGALWIESCLLTVLAATFSLVYAISLKTNRLLEVVLPSLPHIKLQYMK